MRLRLAITAIGGRRQQSYYAGLQTQAGDSIVTQSDHFILLSRGNTVTENIASLLAQDNRVIITQNGEEIALRSEI